MSDTIPALLVGHRNMFLPAGGGVQSCNREYEALLRGAGFELHRVAFDHEIGLGARVLNRIFPKVSNVKQPSRLLPRIRHEVQATNAAFVFFGLNLFPRLSAELRRSHPSVGQVLLSYGVESLDFCIAEQIRRRAGSSPRSRAVGERMLGRQLLEEARERREIDAVLTLSPFEAEVEKWLGSARALWVPRVILEARLDAAPVDRRVGCVSTLDHPPNRDGLEQLFAALRGRLPEGFRFRLVGGPTKEGAALMARYPFVDYLGALGEAQLQAEARSWCCFVHPLFVYPKGCSMKLAVGLGWGLPIATTEFGARGYAWDTAVAPLARSPAELADLVVERCAADRFERHRRQTDAIVEMSPRLDEVARQVRAFLQPR